MTEEITIFDETLGIEVTHEVPKLVMDYINQLEFVIQAQSDQEEMINIFYQN